jgi:hypothetical protein
MRLKTAVVHLRMTEWEKETLLKLAKMKGMNQSEYVRWIIARESASI